MFTLAVPAVLIVLSTSNPTPVGRWMEHLIRTATGWVGLVLIFIYSFLIAFILPGVSEVILAAPIDIGLPQSITIWVIILVGGIGKAAGSVVALIVGNKASHSGPVIKALRKSPIDIVEWSEKKSVELVRHYGYIGLAFALSVPGFPDTLPIYAFSTILERDYYKFALATFFGSVMRLIITLGFFTVVLPALTT